jgi:transcriptional/translational regulatory protein YebC/TACO1
MADPGSVAYLFSRRGVVTLEKDGLTEDDVLTAVLDAGAGRHRPGLEPSR